MSQIVDIISRHIPLSAGEEFALHARFNDLERIQETAVTTLRGATIITGNVQIDPSIGVGLFYNGAPTINLEPDGDAFFGSDLRYKDKTTLSIFSNAQQYNGEDMGAGDLLVGDNTDEKANIHYDQSLGTLNFRVGEDTKLYIDTEGDLILEGVIRSANYESFVSGFEIDAATGDAEFNNVRIRGAMTATVFQYDNLHAVGSTFAVYKAASKVHSDVTTAAVSSTFSMDIDNDPSGTALFAVNDHAYCSFFNGTSVKAGYMKVTVVGSNSGEYTTYTLETISSGIASTEIPEGTPIANYGVTGDGRIALKGGIQPHIDISTFNSSGPSLSSNLRAGDLDGVLGITSTTYGFACGDLGGSSTDYFKATSSGVEIVTGGGALLLDAQGVTIYVDTSYQTKEEIKFSNVDDGTIAGLKVYYDPDVSSYSRLELYIDVDDLADHAYMTIETDGDVSSQISIRADRNGSGSATEISLLQDGSGKKIEFSAGAFIFYTGNLATQGGLHVGGATDPGNDNLWVDGYAEFKGGLHIGTIGTDPGDDILLVDGQSKLMGGVAAFGGLNRGPTGTSTARYLEENFRITDGGVALEVAIETEDNGAYNHYIIEIYAIGERNTTVNHMAFVRYYLRTKTSTAKVITKHHEDTTNCTITEDSDSNTTFTVTFTSATSWVTTNVLIRIYGDGASNCTASIT